MKIEVWTPTLDRATGGNLYDRELAEALHRRNHEVLVRQFHPGRPRAEMFRGAPAPGTRCVLQDELLHASFRPLNRLLRLRPGRPARVRTPVDLHQQRRGCMAFLRAADLRETRRDDRPGRRFEARLVIGPGGGRGGAGQEVEGGVRLQDRTAPFDP